VGQTGTDVLSGYFRGRRQVSGEQMSGQVMLTVRRGLWITATAAVGPQCSVLAMRNVSVIGSQLKSTKLPSYISIIPADSAKTSSCYVICCRRPLDAQRQLCDDAHGDGFSGGAAS